MRHKTSIEIFTYWDHIRRPYDAPLRTQVEPASVRHILSELFILEAMPSGAPRFRLAGTKVCSLFGRELRETSFASLWAGSQPDDPVKIAAGVMAHAVPALINATGYSITGRHMAFEMVLLPLRSTRGEDSDRLLGCLAPALNASWFGAEPLEFLALDRSRLLTDRADNPVDIQREAETARSPLRGSAEWGGALRRMLTMKPFDGRRAQ